MISELISTPVVDIYKGKEVGNVLNIMLNEELTKVEGIIFFDDENEYFIKYKDIFKQSKECIMVRDETTYNFFYEMYFSPINKKVYSLEGNYLGKIVDIMIEKDKVIKYYTDKCEFYPNSVISSGENCLVLGEKKLKKKRVNFKKFMTTNNTVKIMEDKEDVIAPQRVTASTDILLNRVVKEQIVGFNNEIIAKKNDIISYKIIELAKKHNRINELMYNSY